MTTYTNLLADIETWYPHSDYTVALKESFITLTEAEMRRRVRVAAMITTNTAFSQSAQVTALPSGWLAPIAVNLDDANGRRLDYMTPNRLRSSDLWNGTGTPAAYTIEGQNIVVAPFTAVTLHLVYYAALSGLTSGNASNWVSTNAYDVYLYGCLRAACEWAMDEEAELRYLAKFDKAIRELNTEQQRARFQHPLIATGGITP